jgi:hypothetical protein
MRIITAIDLLPNVQKCLPKVEEERLFHKQHGLKHPAAIFNTSYGKVIGAVKDFLDSYDDFVGAGFGEDNKGNQATPLLKNYRQFLYVTREYLDDCLHVVKAFIEPNASMREERNQYQWLKLNAQEIISDFFENIADYKRYIDTSVNELKHNNGILGSIVFYSERSPDVCAGYFIANVTNECYEPVEKIHPLFHDSRTGFSFRRDLTYNLYNLYFIAEEVQKLLEEKLKFDFSKYESAIQEAPKETKDFFIRVMDELWIFPVFIFLTNI